MEFYNFVIVPGFSTPDWAKGAVMYQIYTDRFYNGDPSNDVETNEYYYIGGYSSRVKDWGEISGDYGRAGILRRRPAGSDGEAGLSPGTWVLRCCISTRCLCPPPTINMTFRIMTILIPTTG